MYPRPAEPLFMQGLGAATGGGRRRLADFGQAATTAERRRRQRAGVGNGGKTVAIAVRGGDGGKAEATAGWGR